MGKVRVIEGKDIEDVIFFAGIGIILRDIRENGSC